MPTDATPQDIRQERAEREETEARSTITQDAKQDSTPDPRIRVLGMFPLAFAE